MNDGRRVGLPERGCWRTVRPCWEGICTLPGALWTECVLWVFHWRVRPAGRACCPWVTAVRPSSVASLSPPLLSTLDTHIITCSWPQYSRTWQISLGPLWPGRYSAGRLTSLRMAPPNIRPHRSRRQMRPIATDGISWSVLSVGNVREPYKNDWTDWDTCWRKDSGGPKKPRITRGPDPTKERAILGVVRPTEKQCKSLLRCTQQKIKLIMASARLLQPTVLLPTCRYHIKFPPWRIRPLRCGLSSKFFDHLINISSSSSSSLIIAYRPLHKYDIRHWFK